MCVCHTTYMLDHAGRLRFLLLLPVAYTIFLVCTTHLARVPNRTAAPRTAAPSLYTGTAAPRTAAPVMYTGMRAELHDEITALRALRSVRLPRPAWRVPVYVLSLGGARLRLFEEEMAAEKQDFKVVNVSLGSMLRTDYVEHVQEPGLIGCTIAHLAFAKQLALEGHRCALVVEDDARFGLSTYWPVALHELCNTMHQRDPEWTTLMLYSSDTGVPAGAKGIEIRRYTDGLWGTVSYLATRRWALNLMRLTGNGTRLMHEEVGARYGMADSVMYQCRGCSAYALRPNYVFPDNLEAGTQVGPVSESLARDELHIKSALDTIRASARFL